MDVNVLREQIKGDPEKIQSVLETLGFENIRYHRSQHDYFSFPRLGGDRANGTSLYCDSLRYNCWTVNDSGDLFSLVMKVRQNTLSQAIQFVCNALGIKNTYQKIHLPFGGFYRQLMPDWNKRGEDNEEYPESILDQYEGLSQKFLKDGIDLLTQERYEIGFDHENNAIAIPIRDLRGRLIGVKVRNNDSFAEDYQRYWSTYPYSKTSVVYGLYQNYLSIQKKGKVVICESEKASMQAASFNCNIVVAVGGHSISSIQAEILKGLMLTEYIVAFDEGISEDEIRQEAEKLQMKNVFYQSKVRYVFDGEHKYLKKGSKDSPTDHGDQVFAGLIRECCKEL